MRLDLEQAQQLSKDYYFSAGRCYYNAQGTVQVLTEKGVSCRYMEGYACIPGHSMVYHAWVEANDTVLDPTWSFFEDADLAVYVPVGTISAAEICEMPFDEMGAPFVDTTFNTYDEYRRQCAEAYRACLHLSNADA